MRDHHSTRLVRKEKEEILESLRAREGKKAGRRMKIKTYGWLIWVDETDSNQAVEMTDG